MVKVVSMAPVTEDFVQNMLESKGVKGVEAVVAAFFHPEEMRSALQEADYIIGDFSFKNVITEETVGYLKKARFIQQPSVGYQHIDVEACARAGIQVANCAGANTVDVAEHTVMSGLCLVKKVMTSSYTTRQGEWRQMEIAPGELSGKVWGILGMGRIGQAVARRLYPFGVKTLYYSRSRLNESSEKELNAEYRDFTDLLGEVDVLSLHCPLTPETRNLINKKSLASMKTGAVIINVARGEIVDEQDLADALQEGKLSGAAVDVFREEPISRDNPLLKLDMYNLLLSPHVAGVSEESKIRIMNMTFDNLVRAINGERPENLVVG